MVLADDTRWRWFRVFVIISHRSNALNIVDFRRTNWVLTNLALVVINDCNTLDVFLYSWSPLFWVFFHRLLRFNFLLISGVSHVCLFVLPGLKTPDGPRASLWNNLRKSRSSRWPVSSAITVTICMICSCTCLINQTTRTQGKDRKRIANVSGNFFWFLKRKVFC